MYPLPSLCRSYSAAIPSLVGFLWAVIHGLTQHMAAADDPGSRNGDDNCSAVPPPAERCSLTGQSNHSMEGEILWLRVVPGIFLYYAQKSQTRRAGSARPVPVHRGVESNPSLCWPQYFLLHRLISPWQRERRQQTWFCPLFSLWGGCTQPGV